MRSHSASIPVLALASVFLMTGYGECVPPPAPHDPQGVPGEYDVIYDDLIKVTLNVGGASQTVTVSGEQTVEFYHPDTGHLSVNLTEFCDRPEVKCPSEALAPTVRVRYPRPNEQLGDLKAIVIADADDASNFIEGVVNVSTGEFLAGLQAQSGGSGDCGAIAISGVSGRFVKSGGAVTGVDKGKIAVGFLGACAFGPVAVGATLTIETGYEAVRVGM